MLYLSNAFSLNMLSLDSEMNINIAPTTQEEVVELLQHWEGEWVSAVGHQSTADVLSDVLDMHIPCNRLSVHMNKKDMLLVAQYTGPRLEEGATTLPTDAVVKFYFIYIK